MPSLFVHQYQVMLQFHMTGNFNNHVLDLADVPKNPCSPSPCGPNSQCREINGQAVCSCVPNYIGTPPNCRPECVTSQECLLNQACVNQKCIDPCPGTCGIGALCQVVNHSPVCSCPNRFTGNPFIRCLAVQGIKNSFRIYLIYYQAYNFYRRSFNCTTYKPLQSFSVRTKFSMQTCRNFTVLFMSCRICGSSTQLSSRMRIQFRLCLQLGLYKPKM